MCLGVRVGGIVSFSRRASEPIMYCDHGRWKRECDKQQEQRQGQQQEQQEQQQQQKHTRSPDWKASDVLLPATTDVCSLVSRLARWMLNTKTRTRIHTHARAPAQRILPKGLSRPTSQCTSGIGPPRCPRAIPCPHVWTLDDGEGRGHVGGRAESIQWDWKCLSVFLTCERIHACGSRRNRFKKSCERIGVDCVVL